jgi:cytochrome c biogenesis protein CcmG/thiol:disulfide interchange protein DsbE
VSADDTLPARPIVARLAALAPLLAIAGLAVLLYMRLYAGDASRIPSPLVGKSVPAFALPALAGMAGVPGLAEADLRNGQPTLVNVFASWCVPCHEEHPALLALAKKGVRIVGIAYKDAPDNARRFLDRNGNPFERIGVDATGTTSVDFGVYGVPETFVVRGDGTIVRKIVGPLTPEILSSDLMPALAKAGE